MRLPEATWSYLKLPWVMILETIVVGVRNDDAVYPPNKSVYTPTKSEWIRLIDKSYLPLRVWRVVFSKKRAASQLEEAN